MISPKALRDAAAKKLSKISTAKIYENTVVENFKAPCFFVEIPKFRCNLFKSHTVEVNATLQITYFPPIEAGERIRSDKSTLCMMDKLAKEFCSFEVEDRILIPENGSDFSFLGENTDILQTSIELSYLDKLPQDEGGETITEVNIRK